MHQQRFLGVLAVRLAAGLVILLIAFGPPSQTPTIIGLATAGLTVALKDFLLAFLGWFLLMGRNGVRVGDWVEIKGVGGEVIEVGLFKTVLLEMGNWTNTGHPTGRRVSFMNGYAIEGHYFNFSTAGQWLWDELQVTVPASGDPYATARAHSRTGGEGDRGRRAAGRAGLGAHHAAIRNAGRSPPGRPWICARRRTAWRFRCATSPADPSATKSSPASSARS